MMSVRNFTEAPLLNAVSGVLNSVGLCFAALPIATITTPVIVQGETE